MAQIRSLINLLAFLLATSIFSPTAKGQEVQKDPIEDMIDSLCTLEGIIECPAPDNSEVSSTDNFSFSNEMILARMASRPSPIPFEMNEQVRKYIDLYAVKRKELLKRMLGMSELYFPMFEEVLDKEGLPLELKYLSVVESALNPIAVSKAGATGIWQFMYQTARMYGMNISSYIDERRDPLKATYAMTRYFKDMYALYNDWLLSIAAYNCGPNNVNKAILRSGGKTNFWEISPFLPLETRGYVPAFLAIYYVMQFAEVHDISPIQPKLSFFDIDTVFINQGASLAKVAEMLDMTYQDLLYLNPSYKKGFIPNGYTGILRIPKAKMNIFILRYEGSQLMDDKLPAPVLANMKLNPDGTPMNGFDYVNIRTKKIHTVHRGESLQSIARKYHVSVESIKKDNRLKSNYLKAGQKLAVYQTSRKLVAIENNTEIAADSGAKAATDTLAVKTQNSTARPDTADGIIYHTVEKGDTIWNIAKRYEASVEHIMQLNKINKPSELQLGKKIKIPIDG
ncbi:MAG: LysM peptidoglycan-binding domain-containing protein [Bacteroidia bacterium]|nr:LysM peptidoglycan-binding domain-containing protein [Bacteroidia bacterium]MCZ2277219.1 LysM peptidoglycan-binding domain-containing protein [Bacteroidia bacterium]